MNSPGWSGAEPGVYGQPHPKALEEGDAITQQEDASPFSRAIFIALLVVLASTSINFGLSFINEPYVLRIVLLSLEPYSSANKEQVLPGIYRILCQRI